MAAACSNVRFAGVEQAAQVGAVHAHPRVADVHKLVRHPQPKTIGSERDLRPLVLHLTLPPHRCCGSDADVGDGGQIAR